MTSGPQGGAPSAGMEQLIGKAIAEPEFRQALVDDPQQAIKSAGIQISDSELQGLTSTSREERQNMVQQLSERTSPWSLTIDFGNSW